MSATSSQASPAARPAPRSRLLPLAVLAGAVALGWLGTPVAGAATLQLTGTEGARVSLNGEFLGTFPLHRTLELEPGLYVVRSELVGHAPYEAELRLEGPDDWLRWDVRLDRLRRRHAMLAGLLLAGSGQRYLGRPTAGWILTGLEVGGLLAGLFGELAVQNHRDDYLLLRARYEAAVTETEIRYYREEAAAALADAQDAKRVRDGGLIVAGASVVLGLLDAWIAFPSVAAGPGSAPVVDGPQLGGDAGPGAAALAAADPAVHAGWRLRF